MPKSSFSKPVYGLVLGVETSCDETGLALYEQDTGIIAQVLHSQTETHLEYGGVVPELAARDHLMKLPLLLQSCLQQAGKRLADVDGIAYTKGPGLAGALLTGASFAASLAWGLKIPAIGIHHMEAHLLSAALEHTIQLPFLGLLISGGHTLLIYTERLGNYQIIGQTVDDAIGEAFDKTAKMMGLGYPGGKQLSALAAQGKPNQYFFTRPMTAKTKPSLNMSFSGLKTEVRRAIEQASPGDYAHIARAFEEACMDILCLKVGQALEQFPVKQLIVAGGVAANQPIRQSLHHLCHKQGLDIAIPSQHLCTDNGAMIAYVGWLRLANLIHQESDFEVLARWSLNDLRAIA